MPKPGLNWKHRGTRALKKQKRKWRNSRELDNESPEKPKKQRQDNLDNSEDCKVKIREEEPTQASTTLEQDKADCATSDDCSDSEEMSSGAKELLSDSDESLAEEMMLDSSDMDLSGSSHSDDPEGKVFERAFQKALRRKLFSGKSSHAAHMLAEEKAMEHVWEWKARKKSPYRRSVRARLTKADQAENEEDIELGATSNKQHGCQGEERGQVDEENADVANGFDAGSDEVPGESVLFSSSLQFLKCIMMYYNFHQVNKEQTMDVLRFPTQQKVISLSRPQYQTLGILTRPIVGMMRSQGTTW